MRHHPPSSLLPPSAPSALNPAPWALFWVTAGGATQGQVHYSVGDNTSLIVSGVTTESMTQRNETEEGEVLT